FADQALEWPVGVHVGSTGDALARAADTADGAGAIVDELAIRSVEPDDAVDVRLWAELFIAGFAIEGPIAEAWRRFNPILVRARGYHQFIASLDGRDVAVSALFNRRRVGWLGA